MKPKLVILRGRPTSGKSTAFANLRKNKKMKDWVFIDHCLFKDKLGKEPGKKKLFSELKKEMPSKKNILIEEMSRESIMKGAGKEVKKYDYEIVVFQFTISTKIAYKRDVKRAKEGTHPFMGKEWIDKLHKMHDERFDKFGILVDTNKLNKKQVVRFIINSLT
jgi:predicted kinase